MKLTTRIAKPATGRRGQNTVEYILIIAAVVGIVLVIGAAMRSQLSTIWAGISSNIGAAGNSMSSSH